MLIKLQTKSKRLMQLRSKKKRKNLWMKYSIALIVEAE